MLDVLPVTRLQPRGAGVVSIGRPPVDPLLGQLTGLEDGACLNRIRPLSYLANGIGDLDELTFRPKHVTAA